MVEGPEVQNCQHLQSEGVLAIRQPLLGVSDASPALNSLVVISSILDLVSNEHMCTTVH